MRKQCFCLELFSVADGSTHGVVVTVLEAGRVCSPLASLCVTDVLITGRIKMEHFIQIQMTSCQRPHG